MIVVQELAKSFGKVKAVSSVSFVALDGRITALLGDNGAGKTTTMRMVAGVLRSEQGEVTIDGRPPENARRDLGILSDAKGLYERLSARENMEYYASLMGLGSREIQNNVEDAIRILELQDIIDRRTKGFSTGQKMKVLLGRLLAFKPKNLLLDEPTSGLDVMATRRLRQVLRGLRESGHCVVFSTHVMQEVEQLCDSIIVMHRGRAVAQGSLTDLYAMTGTNRMEEAFVKLVGEGDA